MEASPDVSVLQQHRYACTLCARRKIKCNKQYPCSNCTRSQAKCYYQNPAVSQRHRKRAADSDLLARITEYEDLLQEHNISFSAYDQGNDSTWIPWDKMAPPKSPALGNSLSASPPIPQRTENLNVLPAKTAEKGLWTSLCPELQNPPIHSGPRSSRTSGENELDTPFSSLSLSSAPDLLELHPEPRYIFTLWHIFLENANPLIKIIHAPSLQQVILESSWNLQAVSKKTEALIFAIYLLAVVSLSPSECQRQFGDEKASLLKRYRNGTIRSLMAADLFSTREIEVLQAFVLFLLADPGSETSMTLTAVAVRTAYKMGLHIDKPSSKLPFFEMEMRIRLWWQIRCLDARALVRGERFPPVHDLANVRMPLNVNDSELHPNMVNCPVEHTGATEMLYCLLRYEGARWQQLARTARNPIPNANAHIAPTLIVKDQAIRDLECIFEDKYLCFCDTRIPLHFLSVTMSRVAICRMRFISHHPRIMPEDTDVLFELSLQLLDLSNKSGKTNFSAQLLTHMGHSQLDALIYMLSELRRRPNGQNVVAAWNLVALFFEEHCELIENREDSFCLALGNLTLEAWQVRWKELVEMQGGRADDSTPWYIKQLQAAQPRESSANNSTLVDTVTDPGLDQPANPPMQFQLGLDAETQLGTQTESTSMLLGTPVNFEDDDTYNVGYWSEFLQM